MAEVFLVALSFVLNALLPYLIVKFDLQHLSGESLSRAWNQASFWSAVIVFGPLSIPVHFAKTRRSFWGLALGLGLGIGAFLCVALVVEGIGWVLGVD